MPPPTPEDLQGFWEMVMLQVDNVDALFADLDTIRADNWQVSALALHTFPSRTLLTKHFPSQAPPQAIAKPPQGSKLTKRPIQSKASASNPQASSPKKSAAAIALAQKREAQRKQFMEMKRKNKLAMASAGSETDAVEERNGPKTEVHPDSAADEMPR